MTLKIIYILYVSKVYSAYLLRKDQNYTFLIFLVRYVVCNYILRKSLGVIPMESLKVLVNLLPFS